MSWNTTQQFLVKEHVGLFKAVNNFDVFDLYGGEEVLECREERLGIFTRLLRFTDYKRMTPFHVTIRDSEGNVIVEVKRGISIFLSNVKVFDGEGVYLGGFKQKFFSLGGAFSVHNDLGEIVCQLKGKWTGWDFRFMKDNLELAHVTKKWAGLGKELFTSADNYVLEIADGVPPGGVLKRLILAAVMCIDMVLKE